MIKYQIADRHKLMHSDQYIVNQLVIFRIERPWPPEGRSIYRAAYDIMMYAIAKAVAAGLNIRFEF